VLYGLAGSFVHDSVFWVYTKIPYATLSSVYGSGDLMNFVYQLYYVVGAPVYILFVIGCLLSLIYFFGNKHNQEMKILVFLGFATFFIAHTLFWYFGIFNSMGLKRVLLGVMPNIAILGLVGFNFVQEKLFSKIPYLTKALTGAIILYIMVFPILPNPAAINVKRDLMLTNEQKLAKEISAKVNLVNRPLPLFYNHFYLSLTLNMDYFNPDVRRELDSNLIQLSKSGTLIIWENMYAEEKSGLSKSYMDKHPDLLKRYECKGLVHQKEMMWALYEKK